MYQITNWILLICFFVAFGVGLPAFLSLFARIEEVSEDGVALQRLFGSRLTLSWQRIASARLRLGARILEVDLPSTGQFDIRRGFFLRLPLDGSLRDEVLEQLSSRGLLDSGK